MHPNLWGLQVPTAPQAEESPAPVPVAGAREPGTPMPPGPRYGRAGEGPRDAHPLVLVSAEEPRVVSLLDHDERDAWLVVLL